MEEFIKKVIENATAHIWQGVTSVLGGLLIAFESSIPFFIPCLIATLVDIWSAYCLGKRVHQKHPELSDGKFKSEYKMRVLRMLLVAFIVIILGAYVDILIFDGGNKAVCCVFGFFLFYQTWSILENWSSENDNPMAKVLQRVMINKVERHLNVPLSDLLLKEKREADGEENDKLPQ